MKKTINVMALLLMGAFSSQVILSAYSVQSPGAYPGDYSGWNDTYYTSSNEGLYGGSQEDVTSADSYSEEWEQDESSINEESVENVVYDTAYFESENFRRDFLANLSKERLTLENMSNGFAEFYLVRLNQFDTEINPETLLQLARLAHLYGHVGVANKILQKAKTQFMSLKHDLNLDLQRLMGQMDRGEGLNRSQRDALGETTAEISRQYTKAINGIAESERLMSL